MFPRAYSRTRGNNFTNVPPCLVVHPGEHLFPRAWSRTRGNIFTYMYSHVFPRAWTCPQDPQGERIGSPVLAHSTGTFLELSPNDNKFGSQQNSNSNKNDNKFGSQQNPNSNNNDSKFGSQQNPKYIYIHVSPVALYTHLFRFRISVESRCNLIGKARVE